MRTRLQVQPADVQGERVKARRNLACRHDANARNINRLLRDGFCRRRYHCRHIQRRVGQQIALLGLQARRHFRRNRRLHFRLAQRGAGWQQIAAGFVFLDDFQREPRRRFLRFATENRRDIVRRCQSQSRFHSGRDLHAFLFVAGGGCVQNHLLQAQQRIAPVRLVDDFLKLVVGDDI